MKNLLVALAGAASIVATLPVSAGPDFQAIDRVRKAPRADQVVRHGDTQAPASADQIDPSAKRRVLPLDHGPWAQTTPWLNQQRVLRAETQARTPMAGAPELATVDQPSSR